MRFVGDNKKTDFRRLKNVLAVPHEARVVRRVEIMLSSRMILEIGLPNMHPYQNVAILARLRYDVENIAFVGFCQIEELATLRQEMMFHNTGVSKEPSLGEECEASTMNLREKRRRAHVY